MKKFIIKSVNFFISILFVLVFISLTPTKVFASSENYYRVINETTPFFSDVGATSPLFYLPYTYYVNVIGETEDMFHVEIGSNFTALIDGYTYKSALFKDDLPVTSPYPEIKVIIKSITVFYGDANLTEEIRYLFKDRLTDYFGKLEVNGETVFCVGYGGTLGYVKETAVYPFDVPYHENELTFLKKDEEEKIPAGQKTDVGFAFKIGVISCLFLAGAVGLFFAVKKKRPPLDAVDGDYENE